VTSDAARRRADRIVADAVARADGLSDFGSDSYREGLERHIDALLAADVANAATRDRSYDSFAAGLATRLRVIQYGKGHPELGQERIERPLMVMGMPRSGTTMVSYLLDRDPARRSLLGWEAHNPVPPATSETLRSDPRCLAMLAAQREFASHSSRLMHLHVEWADGPTEDLALHSHDMKSLLWEQFGPVPAYMRWLVDEADLRSAYEYERRVLQILQSRAPGIWQLKQPSHALFVDTLLEVFPDARLVWIHRDPFRTAGSLFSLMSNVWTLSAGINGHDVLREHYPHYLAEHLKRPLRAGRRIGAERIYDLHYARLMRDPIGELRSLYDWAGDELTPAAEAGMRAWLDENPQDRYGTHSYTLAQFGVTVADLEPWFAEYLAEYDIEPEGLPAAVRA
jgi:hypothetical protein